jgi:glutathione peroxidase
MKVMLFLFLMSTLGVMLIKKSTPLNSPQNTEVMASSFYDYNIAGIDGTDSLKMSDFKGKYVLCVNVASKCGYTPQYKDLQALYEKYQEKLVIIGFPCNQFLMQEPGSEEEIVTFCERNYGVNFPLTEKIKVKGKDQHPIYAWLTSKERNGVSDAKVGWNFNKFLISPEGKWLGHFPSKVKPLDEEITAKLQ